MKIRLNPFSRAAIVVFCSISIVSLPCYAAPKYFDTTVDPGLLAGTATWDAGTTAVWSSASTGDSDPLLFWDSGDDAFFETVGANIVTLSGTVIANSVSQAVNGTVTTIAGGTALQLGAGGLNNSANLALTVNSPINLSSNQSWNSTGSITVAGPISQTASGFVLTKTGNGIMTISGANTFSGGMTVSGGVLRVGTDSVNATTTVTSGGVGTGNLTLNNGTTLAANGGTTRTISVSQYNIAGNITLGQATTGTGRLQLAGVWDLGGAPRSVTLGKSSVSFVSGNEVVRFHQPTGFVAPSVQNGALTLTTATGTALLPSVARIGTTTNFVNNTSLTLDDGVAMTSGTGSFFGTTTNSPALTLNAPVSNGGGVLQMGDGTTVVRNATVYSLAGGGTVSASNTTGVGTGTLTINNGNNAVFSGSIQSAAFGVIALSKSGPGTQVLSGTNTYTGATAVTGGKLVTTTKSSNGTYATSASTTLGVKVDTAGTDLNVTALTFAASTLEIDLNNLGNPTLPVISNAGNTVLNGTVTVNILNPALLTTGPITLVDTIGTRTGTGAYVLGALPAGVNATLSEASGDLVLTINSISPVYQWTGATNALWDSSPANVNWIKSGLATAYSDVPNYDVIFDDSAPGSTAINIAATVSPKSTTIDSTAKTYTLAGSGKISGTGGLSKKGSSTVTISTPNDYLGTTSIDAGTFKLGASNVIPDGTVNVAGILDLAGFSDTVNALGGNGQLLDSTAGTSVLTVGNADTTSSFGGIITGTVGLTKSGTGTFTLTGTTSHTGATLISGGTLEIGSGGTSGLLSPSSALTNNGIFRINRSNTATQGTDFPVINSGALTKSGTGTTVLNTANGYSGVTTVESGSLALTVPGALGGTAAGTTALSGASILLRNGITVSGETATITGFGNGSRGVIRADGADAEWAGNIVVVSSTSDTRLGGSVAAGGTLTLSGIISGGDPTNITDTNAAFNGYPATVSVRSNDASDTVVLSGANSFTGNFGIFVGQVRLDGGNNRLPTTSRLLLGFVGTAPALDLNGRSQQLAGLYDYQSGSAALATVTNTSGAPATLTVDSTDIGQPAGAGLSADATPTYTGTLSGNLALVKSGTGHLTLKSANSYTGSTTVSGGILTLGNGTDNTSLSDAADVVIGASGTLKLDYTGTDTVDQLTIGGVGKAPGIYGKPGSGAQFTDPQIDGTGTLTVTTGPSTGGNFASWANDPLKGNIPGEPALGDFDFDGLSNITEYALGLNPRVSSVPAGTFSGSLLTFTKGADAIANGDVIWVIEESTGLTSWSPAVTQPAGNSAPSISYSLPTGQPKVFARLKVTQVP
jgi:fibronectin-binding autotransporter adhesin